nr:RNA-directed DNA polymerase (reverse transcriptase) domain containing protein [Haemonchus contortus]
MKRSTACLENKYSAWAAPIVVVKKSNGTLRLCADFSTGLNDALMLHQDPLPTSDVVFAKLNGGTAFTQIDFADAYLQIKVVDEAKELLTINTHRGLLRYNRLLFGVKSAPGILQQTIDSMICGLEGCAAYLDDDIVTSRIIEEHVANLKALFKRIPDHGFRVRMDKCSYSMPQLRYLRNIIDSTGRRPDPAKIDVIHGRRPGTIVLGDTRLLWTLHQRNATTACTVGQIAEEECPVRMVCRVPRRFPPRQGCASLGPTAHPL